MVYNLIIITICALLGWVCTATMVEVKSYIPLLLGLIMFSMGVTLELTDFRRVLKKWKLLLLGSGLQFLIMPFLAWLISWSFQLSPSLTVGMVLVGSVPGGTASNVIVFLGKGNLPLSISLTFLSTLLSPLFTPLLINVYVGKLISFDILSMIVAMIKIVLAPLVVGMFFKKYGNAFVGYYSKASSLISAVSIGLIIACVIGLNKASLQDTLPIILCFAIILHNISGYILGYLAAKWMISNEKDARTIAIEVGMQNSGLAVALAQQFFSNFLTASLPGALFSLWHNLSGLSIMAVLNRKKS